MRKPSKSRHKPFLRSVVRVFRARRAAYHETRDPAPPSSSVPFFRKRAQAGAFSFGETESWHYGDAVGHGQTINPLIGITSDLPHLVLRDRRVPRAVLQYSFGRYGLLIHGIQRLRTQYRRIANYGAKFRWDSERENVRSREFGRELKMHPSEFLLCEFLHRNRATVLSGVEKTYLMLSGVDEATRREAPVDYEKAMKPYRQIIAQFFVEKPAFEKRGEYDRASYFELDLNKPLVRNVLGLPPLKK